MAEFQLSPPEHIADFHQTQSFDCGKPPLNEFLQRFALTNDRGGGTRTFVVATTERVVVGYYSLAAASVNFEVAPERVKQGQPHHPIPAILMARFAVDLSQQGKGLGRALFRDALLRSLNITEELGARAFVVDAKDEEAARFYARFGMMASPANSFRLFLLFKDVKKILSS